jgi:hypothetical protein
MTEKLKVFMLKLLVLFLFGLLFASAVFAKPVELAVIAKKSDVTKELNEETLLSLNGMFQAVTGGLEDLKLDSKNFWDKLEQKKLSNADEYEMLKPLFENVLLARPFPSDPKEGLKKEVSPETKLEGTFKADLNTEKLRALYEEVVSNLAETKTKTFYILSNIDIDSSMTWDDVGVSEEKNFTGAVTDSWKKLIEKDFKGYEKVVVLDRDFATKPDYMNSQSVTLKWTSTFRKVFANTERKTANYELSAQYVLVNTKSDVVLTSFDFPLQKRELDTQNKKALSSALASLVYNLFYSQTSKLNSLLETAGNAKEQTSLDVKVTGMSGLSEIFAVNSFLQDKFKDIKLSSQMKSYASDGAILTLRAEGNTDKILDSLSLEGGKYPLNEQKVLLFNRADKTFAIIPKDSNNKN